MSNSPYDSQSQSGYNSGAPPDDGSQTSDNRVSWEKHKEKLGDPVLTLSQDINAANIAAFGKTLNTDGSEQNLIAGSIGFSGATVILATGELQPSRQVHTIKGATATDGPAERTSLRYIATVTGTASNPGIGTEIRLYAATATEVILLVDKTHTQLASTTSTATLANIRTRGRDMLVLDKNVPTILVTTASEAVEISRPGIQQGFRNLVINGDMRIAQRGTSQAVVGATATMVTVDRWGFNSQGTPQARYTQTQESSGGPNDEFPYWLKMDVTTAEAGVTAGEADTLSYTFEAQDLQHLKWGSADAKDVIVGFRFLSPKSGIHTCSLFQPDGSRSYVSEFVMSATDQWETIYALFPGDTGGTITNDTGAGLVFHVPITAGSNFQVTADAWAAGEDYGTSNSQNLADNTANNIGLTGVQLEVAPATPFEHRPVGQELGMAKRYYEIQDYTNAANESIAIGQANTATQCLFVIGYEVQKRAVPTITLTAAGTFDVQHNNSDINVQVVGTADEGDKTFRFTADTGAASVTQGNAVRLHRDSSDTTTIQIDAEL